MSQQAASTYSLFLQSLAFEDPVARQAFLAEVCGDKVSLRAEIVSLLEAHQQAHRFLERPLVDPFLGTDAPYSDDDAGLAEHNRALAAKGCPRAIGNYRLQKVIGEGGFGVVYLAEQTEPIRRSVALKLIKPGMDSAAVLKRFDNERQLLAMMEHSHIAQIFDAGATEDGYPYFVMELVTGVPITEYCDGLQLGLEERLRLLRDVCSAIEHAHQKGIIHRDIKPSNVLISVRGEKPTVKIIDFGIAKALHYEQDAKSIVTRRGEMVGTPQYMSPEQFASGAAGVDTRTDVYGLGVLLYQLLTGTTPLAAELAPERLAELSYDELRRLICEQETPRPSTVLQSTIVDDPSHQDSGGHARLKQLREELDWVALKAVEKEPANRYATVTELAQDISRFLNHEPVLAMAPSSSMRLKKFVRRHRAAVIGSAAILMVLISGLLSTSYGLWRAGRAKLAIEQALATEERERKRSEDALQFLTAAFASPDPFGVHAMTANEVLAAAEEQVGKSNLDDPVTRALLLGTLAISYAGLGETERGLRLAAEARQSLIATRGVQDLQTEAATDTLIDCMIGAGKAPAALALAREALERRTKNHGADHAATIFALTRAGQAEFEVGNPQEGMRLLEAALQAYQHAPTLNQPQKIADLQGELGRACVSAGKYEAGVQHLQQAAAYQEAQFGPEAPTVLATKNNLAHAHAQFGQPAAALEIYQQIVPAMVEHCGNLHPFVLSMRNNLASAHLKVGNLADAESIINALVADCVEHLPSDDSHTAYAMGTKCSCLLAAEKYEEAVEFGEKTLITMAAAFGEQHPTTLGMLGNLAVGYAMVDQYDRAIELLEQSERGMGAQLGDAHPRVFAKRVSLGDAYLAAKRLDDALAAYNRAYAPVLRGEMEAVGIAHAHRARWANLQLRAGKFDEAETALRDFIEYESQREEPAVPVMVWSRLSLSEALLQQGRPAEALTMVESTLAEFDEKSAPLLAAFAQNVRGAALEATGKQDLGRKTLQGAGEQLLEYGTDLQAADTWWFEVCLRRVIDSCEAAGEAHAAMEWSRRLAEFKKQHPPTKRLRDGTPIRGPRKAIH